MGSTSSWGTRLILYLLDTAWSVAAWWYTPPKGIRVTRVVVIDDSKHIFEYIPWVDYLYEEHRWEDFVDCCIGHTLSPQGRVEIRYMDGSIKKRKILYPGDECDPFFPKPERKFFLSAQLIPRDSYGHTTKQSVLSRVQKYHGSSVTCASHMFPFEDECHLKETYACIRIIDLFFQIQEIPFLTPEEQKTVPCEDSSEAASAEPTTQ
jgi:hypothetical protein